jgi:hypothetical protein
MTDSEKLDAIRARINGEWDNKNLLAIGPISFAIEDIIRILDFEQDEQKSILKARLGSHTHD